MEVKRIGVLGAGTMGTNITHIAARSGFEVVLMDVKQEILDQSISKIRTQLEKAIAKGKETAEGMEQVLAKIECTTGWERMAQVDLVIEAVIENLIVKKEVFSILDNCCPAHTILASNTSSMSITEIAGATNRPRKVAGMHFFHPVQVMQLVEVIYGYYTSDETVETVGEVVKQLGKTQVLVKKDTPGFIVNRLLIPYLVEAYRLVEEGVASIEDIDTAVKLGLNYPMGPFQLSDLSGNDIVCNVADYFFQEWKNSQYAPPLALKQMVKAGRLGQKTGKGWYDYNR